MVVVFIYICCNRLLSKIYPINQTKKQLIKAFGLVFPWSKGAQLLTWIMFFTNGIREL